jgi:predicted branched-subunit amino acid permease
MKLSKKELIKKGIKDGIPICMGYFAVSLTFGIQCGIGGLTVFQAVLISITNLTSAGQFGGLELILAKASYIEMLFTEMVLNIRYLLMSTSLSQKIEKGTSLKHRLLMSYGITDEIFGVSMLVEGRLSPYYTYGVMIVSIFGWVFGTFVGVSLGNFMPSQILDALSIAIYAMFIAIIIPPAKKDKIILLVVIASMTISGLFTVLPILNTISSGFRIIIVTLLVASLAAYKFPIKDETNEE